MTASTAVPGSKVAGASSSGRDRKKEKNEPEQDAPATSAMKTSDIHIRDPWRQSDAPIYGRDGGHGMLFHDFDGRLWMPLHHPNTTPNERPLRLRVVETDGGLTLNSAVEISNKGDAHEQTL